MKALFKSKFPFVELPDEELTNEQLSIKKQYENTYGIEESKELVKEHLRDLSKALKEAGKPDRLRNVHGNAGRTGKRANRAGNDSGDSDALLQGADEPELD